MPYFNPNKVDFNYNTNTIDAVGATGRALWDIYQDSVKNNFTKQKLAEENRSNLATEQHNINKLNEDIRHHTTTETETANNNAITQGFKRDELGLKGQELNLKANKYQNDALYNHLMANVAMQNANTNENRLNFDIQKYNNDDKKLQTQMQNDLTFSALGGAYPQGSENWDDKQKADYRNAWVGMKNNSAVRANEKTPGQKNAIAVLQNGFNKGLNELAALDRLIIAANNAGGGDGISTLGGGLDKFKMIFPNLNEDARKYIATMQAYQSAYADNQKGQGNFNYKNMGEQLSPGWTGADVAAENIKARRAQTLSELNQIINQAKAQDYAGADDMQRQLQPLIIDDERINNILYGKEKISGGFGASALYNPADQAAQPQQQSGVSQAVKEKFEKRKRGRVDNDDFQQNLDEHGALYAN